VTDVETLVALAMGVIVIGGSVLFGLRASRSSMKALRDQVATVNATLGELAHRLGLGCTIAAPYQHPIVGSVPAYAVLAGERGGLAVRIDVVSDEDSANVAIMVMPRAGVRWPDIGRVKPKRDVERHPALGAALAGIDDAAQEIRIEPTSLRVIARHSEATAAELHALVDATLVLARAL
jgi:hypothetical protein